MSKKRVITGTAIVVLMVALFFSRLLTPLIFDLAFGVLSVLACIEVSKVAYEAGKFNNVYFVASYPAILYLITMLFINKQYTFNYYLFAFLLVILVYFVVIFITTLCTRKATIDEMAKVGYKGKKLNFALDKSMFSLAIIVYPAVLFLTIVALNHFNEFTVLVANANVTSGVLSTFALVLIFAISMVCDTMAMITGITFKGKKLCPKISPNKTISGAIGGLVGGVASALIVYAIFRTSGAFVADFSAIGGNIWHILVMGIIGAVVSQVGDITASLLKRHAGVKDYGNVFPGHGGVMDRLDGVIFNAAFIFLYFIILAI